MSVKVRMKTTSQLSVLLRVWIGHVQNGLLLLQIYREDQYISCLETNL